MQEASDELEFERAARYRDRLAALSAIQAQPGHQPADGGGGGRLRPARGGRAVLHPGVLLPQLPELGQPRLFPEGGPLDPARRGAERLHRPVLRRQAAAAPACCSRTRSRSASCWPRRCARAPGTRSEIAVPRRGEKRDLVEHACSNAREALGRRLADTSSQPKLLAALAQAFGLPDAAAARRGLRQLPHHGHERRRRDDRGRAGRASPRRITARSTSARRSSPRATTTA